MQKVTSLLLYFTYSIDSIILLLLSNITIDISTADNNTLLLTNHILNCVYTSSNPYVWYKNVDIIIYAHSNGSYLCASKAKSQGDTCIYVGNNFNAQ